MVARSPQLVIVSADSHVGPRLAEELRPYCPSAHLDEFDGLVGQVTTLKANIAGFADFLLKHPNFKTEGHHDSAARLADYDYDGVAAGVIFTRARTSSRCRSVRSCGRASVGRS